MAMVSTGREPAGLSRSFRCGPSADPEGIFFAQSLERMLVLLAGFLLAAGLGGETTRAQTPPIVPVADSPQEAGSTFRVDVKVGSEDVPVSDLFGTSFALDYDESALSVAGDEAGDFLGEDVVYQADDDSSAGEIGIGVSRKSGAGGVEGSGVVARVRFEIGEDVPEGTELSFSITEVEANDPEGGEISLDPDPRTVQVGTGPAAPTGLSATGGDGEVQLGWTTGGSESPDGYNVYRATSLFDELSAAEKVNESLIGSTSYTDRGVENGTEYFFRVTAVGDGGAESRPSGQASVTPTAEGAVPPVRPVAASPRPPGEAFSVRVQIGSDEQPVEDLFGASFTLEYDASRLSVMDDEAGAFFGDDVVYTSNDDAGAGEIGIGVSRKSGAGGASGTGVVARVKFMAGSGVADGTELGFSLDEVEANGPDGSPIALGPQDRSVTISSVPPLRPEVTSPQTPGEEFEVGIRVGSEAYSVSDLFGTSFTLEYDRERVSVAGDEAGPLLGDDVVYTSNDDPPAGEIGIGVSRKSGAGGVDGSGVVARVQFRAGGGAPEGTAVSFALAEARANGPNGDSVELRPEQGETVLRTPAASQAATVRGNGPVDFGDTGVTVDFAGTEGSGTASVRKYEGSPDRPVNISEQNLGDYRFVMETGPGVSVGSGTEVRFDVGSLAGISAPEDVVAYKRPRTGRGPFDRLSASLDAEVGELVVQTDSFSEFAFASDSSGNPLPVELAALEARSTGKDAVRIAWTTASERENAGFQVQRKSGNASGGDAFGEDYSGKDSWQTVGQVEGTGSATNPASYQFTDEELPYEADRLIYRLKQIDTDGTVSYSRRIAVERGPMGVQLLSPHPNPTRTRATVQYAVPEPRKVSIRLYDPLGRQVRTVVRGEQEGRHEKTIDLSGLASGVYFLQLRSNGEVRTRRLTVVQ